MATRTHAREAILGVLYAAELGNLDAIANAHSIFFERKIRNKQLDFALGLLDFIKQNEPKIDFLISKNLKNLELGELGKVELCVLRIGVGELMRGEQKAVVINEMIELAKSYADHNAPNLINGVLDAASKADFENLDSQILKVSESKTQAKTEKPKFSKNTKDFKKLNSQKSHSKKPNFKKSESKRPESKKSEAKKPHSQAKSPNSHKPRKVVRLTLSQISESSPAPDSQKAQNPTNSNE